MSHLYIIHAKGAGKVKIGISKHPGKRIKQLQTGNPFDLEFLLILEGRADLERELHQCLKRYRSRNMKGEWFDEEGLANLPDWIYEQIDLELL